MDYCSLNSSQYALNFGDGPAASLNVRVLGSSSAGNCTVVWNGQSAVMVDCGFAPSYITRQLHASGLAIPRISAMLITHVHSDHVNNDMFGLAMYHHIPIYTPRPLHRILTRRFDVLRRAQHEKLLRDVDAPVAVGDFTVDAFSVPHDSPGGCFGYTLRTQGKKIAIATDLGFPEDGLHEHFADADAIVIESNHDPEMLENSGRPAWLKKRIREIGHLSNGQCAGFLVEVLQGSRRIPDAVVLAHISQQCNTNPLALDCTRTALGRSGFERVEVVESFKGKVSEVVKI